MAQKKSRSTPGQLRPAAPGMAPGPFVLTLYVTGATAGSLRAIANIKAIQLPIGENEEAAALPGTVIRGATLTRGDL